MALTDYQITAAELAAKGVVSAADTLTGTPAQNKAVFDRLITEVVAVKFNQLIADLQDMLSGGIASYLPESLTGAQIPLSGYEKPSAGGAHGTKGRDLLTEPVEAYFLLECGRVNHDDKLKMKN